MTRPCPPLVTAVLVLAATVSCGTRLVYDDALLWMEDIRGEEALAWAKRENAIAPGARGRSPLRADAG